MLILSSQSSVLAVKQENEFFEVQCNLEFQFYFWMGDLCKFKFPAILDFLFHLHRNGCDVLLSLCSVIQYCEFGIPF